MDKLDVIKKMKEEGIVAVVRAESKEKGEKLIDAIVIGGINFIEITMTVPGAVDIIKELSEKYKGTDVVIGAGTVLDSETARIAILSGANYIVSPSFDLETAKLCNRYRVPYMPGCMTIKEVITAMEAGADIIMLDNMTNEEMAEAIKIIDGRAEIEVSGNVTKENIARLVDLGVDFISSGALTHSAPIMDISLKNLHPIK